jgi:acyl-CoA reductase-like NAD-dependent aldehyde dehydrogenase
MTGRTALVLVDLQEDFFARPNLTPPRSEVVSSVSQLLGAFRAAELPVAHARTIIATDGSDAMPHWADRPMCVIGTRGAEPPAELAATNGEFVGRKSFYDAFVDPGLEPWLRAQGVTTVVIAGLYTHACVRETALAAYERGFSVVIARDAVGTDSPAHAAESLAWIEGRAARVLGTQELHDLIAEAPGNSLVQTTSMVDRAAQQVAIAQHEWERVATSGRRVLLKAWMKDLEKNRQTFIDAIVADVFKPVALATDEVNRAIAHVASAVALPDNALSALDVSIGVTVVPRPLGVVGILMPWNNPLALPVGKLAPALMCGNGVMFKPAPEAERIAQMTVESLVRAGMPSGLVEIVTGGAETGREVVSSPVVSGVAVTGSVRTGRSVASSCLALGKPIQAELGGNNAAIVLDDVDVQAVAVALVRNAFAYSGQRCTALRRFVVLESIAEEFTLRAIEEANRLEIGGPNDITTFVGPVISQAAAERILSVVREATSAGNDLLAGGTGFEALGQSFIRPTLIRAHHDRARIVQEETFGPVAVIQIARDVDHALELANGVEQGLIMSVCTSDERALAYIADRANVGVVSEGPRPVPVHPDAPFGGWKASGIGSPEHGVWDLSFFTRPQVLYRP